MQTLYRILIQDPQVIAKYNEKEDNLFLALYFKNPPGRILRKKWSADWRVLPNLENWINFFKNNDQNNKNEVFYNIDYEKIGNFHDRIKYMYPTDNSIMVGQKFTLGNQQFYRYRVLKEGVAFGIKETADKQASFWVQYENNTALIVELENNNL
jgi:hypothetical protein